MNKKMKIGIFGGAFNPIHNGHMLLAQSYFKSLQLDKIILIPTAVPPHKSSEGLADFYDRYNMAKLASRCNDRFLVSDIEYKRRGKSYTYNTLIEMKALYPNSEFFLIVGADQFLNFHKWHRYKDILNIAVLCTSARESEEEKQTLYAYAKSSNELQGRYFIADYPVFKLSSSEIRDKLQHGADVSKLLNPQVYNYIVEKGLYSV